MKSPRRKLCSLCAAIIALLLPGNSTFAGDLVNLSSRGFVGTGEDVLIGGFIVTGNGPKRVILRALGASVSVNGSPVPGILADPNLDLYDSSGLLLQSNDDWRYGPELEIEASQLAPTDDYESVIIANLAPANYTASFAATRIAPGSRSWKLTILIPRVARTSLRSPPAAMFNRATDY